MADYENEVGISIKTHLGDSNTQLEKLDKNLLSIKATMDLYNDKMKMFRDLAYGLEKMANVNTKKLEESLKNVDDYMGKISNTMQSVNAQQFTSAISKMQSSMGAYSNLLRSLNRSVSISNATLSGDGKSVLSMPTIDISAYQNLVSAVSSMDIDSFVRFSTGIRNFTDSTRKLMNLKIDNSVIENLRNTMNQIGEVYSSFIQRLNGMNLSGFAESMREIAKVPNTMKKMSTLDTKKVGQSFDTITQKIREFIVTLNEGEGSLKSFATITTGFTGFNRGINETRREVDRLGSSGEKTGRKLSNMLSFGKIYAIYNQVRHFSQGFVSMLNKSIDFTEIENYFSRAMGNMRGEAMKFQNQLSDMFGLAMPDMMKAQATFKNMLGSFGDLSDSTAYMLSERLTKMSLDFSSLYNVSFESALTKFQAAMSKQVRPVRSVSGYDITQSVLSATMQEIGINDRKIAQMNEMEKRLLIILTLQNQMGRSQAMNDLARTIKFSGFIPRGISNNLVNASKSGVVDQIYC